MSRLAEGRLVTLDGVMVSVKRPTRTCSLLRAQPPQGGGTRSYSVD